MGFFFKLFFLLLAVYAAALILFSVNGVSNMNSFLNGPKDAKGNASVQKTTADDLKKAVPKLNKKVIQSATLPKLVPSASQQTQQPTKTLPPKDKSIQLLKKFFKSVAGLPAPKPAENTAGKIVKPKPLPVVSAERAANHFYQLGAYPDYPKNVINPKYDKIHMGLFNDDDYCERVDAYNLANPENMLKKKTFFTDFLIGSVPRTWVMAKIGTVPMREVHNQMKNKDTERRFHLPVEINAFHTNGGRLTDFHKMGQHIVCATQIHNHIPGFKALVHKDAFVDSYSKYAKLYESRPQCFDGRKLLPKSYRLHYKEECLAFFELINSAAYKESLKKDPIQYLMKIGVGSHKSEGVFILNQELTEYINSHYQKGKRCGLEHGSLIAQAYVSNPLLLDKDNKFDFRVYMLIASTDPFIVYYHDGFIKVALSAYEKDSTDRGTHLTNTYLANQKIEEANKQGKKLYGMTKKQLEDYILWNYDRFLKYLLKSGKVKDPKWLNNYLRPAFHKAFIHLIRMTKDSFLKQPNLYQLHGLDFMLDDQMQLWFIESNPGPQLSGTSMNKMYYQVVWGLFDIEFAYYRSRMKRVLNVIKKMEEEKKRVGFIDYEKWKVEYQEASRNRLEPEYQISKKNTWQLVMDENLKGSKAYMNYIPTECL